MTEETMTIDQSVSTDVEAPNCGIYIILPNTDDHEKQCFKLGQALHGVNRFSNYSLNRHVVEFRANGKNDVSDAAVKAYQETCYKNGFIFLVADDARLARAVNADGVICSSIQKATEARKMLSEESIVGLRCSTKSAAKSALDHDLDFITIYSEKNGDTLLDILNWWTTATDNPIAVEGQFNQENCESFVRAEATFIDSTHHIWTHPSGNMMQGVVNMMDAFERYKPLRKQLN
jgi:thiamine monophosphate synthase